MDYLSFGEKQDGTDMRTGLIIKDKWSRSHFCHVVIQKGKGDEQIVKKAIADIEKLGYNRIILKTDGELALVQVQTEIINRRKQETVPENPPAYDPQSNGVVERGVEEVK